MCEWYDVTKVLPVDEAPVLVTYQYYRNGKHNDLELYTRCLATI
jgi:hypothetical protein